MQFYLVDVNEGDQIAEEYKVENMPTFIIFKNGEEIERMQGSNDQALKELVRRHSWLKPKTYWNTLVEVQFKINLP